MTDLAPQQRRSRETMARLLRATIETLAERGLAGTTLPHVAAVARVAPASIYRRFADKDALFRAAFLDVLERSAAATEAHIRDAWSTERRLDATAAAIVRAIMDQYREHPRLLRALTRFVETDTDASFREAALAHVARNVQRLAQVVLRFRDEISHADPERAVTFALLNVATVVEVTALDPISIWPVAFPATDEELHAELTRAFLAYLRNVAPADVSERV